MKNKYIIRSRISEKKFRAILKLFCVDIETKKVSELTSINRVTINKIFDKIRVLIAKQCEADSLLGLVEIELDESYFGAKRVRGKRGRGSSGKIPVLGILKRNGKIYIQIIKNCSIAEIITIIEDKIEKESTLYTDGFKTYDGLVDYGLILNGYDHYRIYHINNEFARGKNHVNGIESFRAFTKRRLSKFNGLKDEKFILHLKESEFRWNHRGENLS